MLTSEKIIVESDGGIEIVATIVAGFDYLNNFVVQYDFEDYREGGKDYTHSAIVNEEDGMVMARHLKVSYADLPQALYDEFGETAGTSVPSEVEDVYKNVLDFILDCGAKYKLMQ